MFRKIIFLNFVLIYVVAQAQIPNRPDWHILGEESSLVVSGVVLEEKLWIIDPEKRRSDERNIPNPVDFVIGRVIRLRVEDVIKNDDQTKAGNTINIVVPGWISTEGIPAFVAKSKYIVFLHRLTKDEKQFEGAMIYRPGAPFGQEKPFIIEGNYTVVRNEHGTVILTPQNIKTMDEIKAAIRKSSK